MKNRGDEIVARARSLLGTAYRPKGRSEEGVDCVGLAAFALSIPAAAVPKAYERRKGCPSLIAVALDALGFDVRDGSDTAPGVLLIFDVGLGRIHLGISTGAAFVHADAGLGRVVERPFPPPWPVAAVWRVLKSAEQDRASWQPSS